jgi:hypothetical protein
MPVGTSFRSAALTAMLMQVRAAVSSAPMVHAHKVYNSARL